MYVVCLRDADSSAVDVNGSPLGSVPYDDDNVPGLWLCIGGCFDGCHQNFFVSSSGPDPTVGRRCPSSMERSVSAVVVGVALVPARVVLHHELPDFACGGSAVFLLTLFLRGDRCNDKNDVFIVLTCEKLFI